MGKRRRLHATGLTEDGRIEAAKEREKKEREEQAKLYVEYIKQMLMLRKNVFPQKDA